MMIISFFFINIFYPLKLYKQLEQYDNFININMRNSEYQAGLIISQILTGFSSILRQKQLEDQILPKALASQFKFKIQNTFNQMTQLQQKPNQLLQQTLEIVPYHGKDSLMPKGVERQTQIDSYPLENESYILPKNKKLNQTRRSHHSVLNSMGKTNRTSNFSIVTSKKKNKPQNFFISLEAQTENAQEDEEIKPLRYKKQLQIQQMTKIKEKEQERRKRFEENQQNFQNGYQNKEFTYDFEGEVLGSEINSSQKIKYHGLKNRLGGTDRKNQSHIKFKQSLNEPSRIIPKPKKFRKQSDKNSNEGIQMSLTIPVFQNQPTGHMFGLPSDKASCRLKQYRKYYGGKFTRLQRESKTIDIGKNTPDEYDQLFKSKRYLKDQEQSVARSFVTNRSIDQPIRKLALPKIKGKYSTLDRYSYLQG